MRYFNQLCFSILLILPFSLLWGQEPLSQSEKDFYCGTQVADANITVLEEINEGWRQYLQQNQRTAPDTITYVPVQLHIIRNSTGGGGISAADFLDALDLVNEYYAYAKIHFYQCAPINTIHNSTYSNYDYSEMNALDAAYSVSNVINIYVADNCTAGSSAICGHAQFPGGLDFIMLATSCAKNGSTFAHELGHYMGLYHTHETYFGAELVNGSNCTTAGDELCDTPADPRLSSRVNSSGCIYTYNGTDANGQQYSPQVSNIMSYSAKECRVFFSDGQYDRMNFVNRVYRSYLTCASPPALNADFYAFPEEDCSNNLTVQFADISDGTPTAWSWNFGDGSPVVNAHHPMHTYTAPGAYSVSLTSTQGGSSDTETQTAIIPVGAVVPPYSEDFETGAPSLGRFREYNTFKNQVFVDPAAANSSTYGLLFNGFKDNSSGYFRTPNTGNCFDSLWNPMYKAEATLCVDATAMSTLQLQFDLWQEYFANNNYTNLRVTVDGIAVSPVYQPGSTDGPWETKTLNLDAYAGNVITIGFEGTHKYAYNYSSGGNASYVDNILITGTAALPVSEIRLEGDFREENVTLRWEVTGETPGIRYLLERSADLSNWQRVAEVAADGRPQYVSTDIQLPAGRAWYRVQAIERDGNSVQSNLVEFQPAAMQIRISPNPARDFVTIQISGEETPRFTLSDISGKIKPVQFYSEGDGFILETSGLAPGIYFLRIQGGNIQKTEKLVITR